MANRSDTFNRANGALGTPSDGGSAWSVYSGAPAITSNTCTGGSAEAAALESSMADCDVSAKIAAGSIEDVTVIGRAPDGNSFVLAGATATSMVCYTLDSGGPGWTLQETVNGLTIAVGDTIGLRMNGTSVFLTLNGSPVGVGSTISLNSTVTTHGLRFGSGGTGTADDFAITALAGGGVGRLTAGLINSGLASGRIVR